MTDEQPNATIAEIERELLKRERRAMRRMAFVIVIPAVLAFALIVVAGARLTRAYAEQTKILKERENALRNLGATADRLRADNASLRAAAQQCDSKLREQTELLTALQQDAAARKRPDAETLRAVARVVREAPNVQQSIATTIRMSSERRVARVYLQIADEGQREAARGVQDYLLAQGYNAPGIERVRKAPTRATEVRYFDPADRTAAARVAELLQSKYAIRAKPAHIKIDRDLPGQLEIWFTVDAFHDIRF